MKKWAEEIRLINIEGFDKINTENNIEYILITVK